MKAALFSTAYLPSISYFAAMVHAEKIIIDGHEHYIKQTYRNRALIYSANGLQQLIVPVNHENLYRQPIREIRIAADSSWKKIHWRSITSSYRNAPYFEFFESDFQSMYENIPETIFEFNLLLTEKIFSALRLNFYPEFTTTYEKTPEAMDFRNSFLPEHRNALLPSYHQVFSPKHGFIPDLSILDLLFNKGMETKNYLEGISSGK